MQVIDGTTDIAVSGERPRQATEAERWLLRWALLICLGVALGLLSFLRLGTTGDLLVGFLRGGCRQIGAIGLTLTVGTLVVGRLCRWARLDAAVRRINVVWLKLLAGGGVALLAAEVFMRAVFFDGASFGWGAGPIVERFEQRYYHLNRFGSRGPDALGPKPPGALRIMVQGDSITFGAGLRDEHDAYPSLVLSGLQRAAPSRIEMSVHAVGGHHIVTHLENLQRFGPEVEPDVLIYQWHLNDTETDEFQQLGVRDRPWASLFCHKLLQRVSYAWWFLDFELAIRLLGTRRDFERYFQAVLSLDQPRWTGFEAVFRAWAAQSRQLCPRVAVLLYPSEIGTPGDYEFQAHHERVQEIASDYGIQTVDLLEYLGDVRDWRQVAVNRFDLHPNAFLHRRMAEVLLGWLPVWWPELFN